VDDGAGGLVDQTVKFPIWFDPVANGGTPMCAALGRATTILQGWLAQHPDCFPPIVINITDGEATDGDPTGPAKTLTSLSSSSATCFSLTCSFFAKEHAGRVPEQRGTSYR
jgi:Mg-chelatase subunit ChlD